MPESALVQFIGFLILLAISIVVAGALHYGLKHYVNPGIWSFVSKVVLGWIGAWLGTPVFGAWFAGINYGSVYIIPAILGSFALVVVAIDAVKMLAGNSSEAGG